MLKKHRVVMLPTNEKANGVIVIDSFRTIKPNMFIITNNDYRHEDYKPYHLYILSDEEIKEGDWFYWSKHNIVEKATKKDFNAECNKIIATTDKLLVKVVSDFDFMSGENGEIEIPAFPQPSQSFVEKYIERYNDGNPITDVMVECLDHWVDIAFSLDVAYRPKINPKDNTITIKPIKESWNREEIEEIHVSIVKQGCLFEGGSWSDEHERLVRLEFHKWFEQNK